MVNFLAFSQGIDFSKMKLKGNTKDELYISLVSKLFNIYMNDMKNDIDKFEFVVPNFFDKDKFRINIDLINNKLTKNYIKDNKKFEYLFKILLGSLNKKKRKPIGLFKENTIVLFNKFIDDIDSLINKYLKRIKEKDLIKTGLLNFDDYFDLNYSTDGEDRVYPDVYDEFTKNIKNNKDKKLTKK